MRAVTQARVAMLSTTKPLLVTPVFDVTRDMARAKRLDAIACRRSKRWVSETPMLTSSCSRARQPPSRRTGGGARSTCAVRVGNRDERRLDHLVLHPERRLDPADDPFEHVIDALAAQHGVG